LLGTVSNLVIDQDGLLLDEHEVAIIEYTNEYRAKNGKPPLKASRRLMGTARLQSWHMTRRGMAHGYTSGWSGENIAQGQSSAREAVNAWINSSGHRANMLGNWKYIGVGGYNVSWAQQFDH
jgi:uncharacterized protein YkwD